MQLGHLLGPEHSAREVCVSEHGCAHTCVCLCKVMKKREPVWPEPLEPDPEALSHACGVAGPPPASEAAVVTEALGWSHRPSSESSRHPRLAVGLWAVLRPAPLWPQCPHL